MAGLSQKRGGGTFLGLLLHELRRRRDGALIHRFVESAVHDEAVGDKVGLNHSLGGVRRRRLRSGRNGSPYESAHHDKRPTERKPNGHTCGSYLRAGRAPGPSGPHHSVCASFRPHLGGGPWRWIRPAPGQHIRSMIALMKFPSGADKAYGNLTCLSIHLANRPVARSPGNPRT